ncbi:MAG: haloacid dehalogenase type II [bacterium]
MIDLRQHEVMSFDCYGTLVDWEAGILGALRPLLAARGIEAADDAILETYARLEASAEEGPYAPYREVLGRVVERFARERGFAVSPAERGRLAESLPSWPLFADTTAALRRLARHFRLGVISNIDDDLFAATRARLGVRFDWVLTAEEAESYKPARRNFEMAMRKAGGSASRWLHVAQSVWHDIVPARELGMTTIWVNRRRGRSGSGATPQAAATPHLEVGSLDELAGLVESSR